MAANAEALPELAPGFDSGLDPRALEPAAWLFAVSPPGGEGAAGSGVVPSAAPRTFDPELAVAAERWVRRLAWGVEGRRGTARLELGAGALAGAELVITTEPGQVSVVLDLPAAADAGVGERLRARLEARGYFTDVTVR